MIKIIIKMVNNEKTDFKIISYDIEKVAYSMADQHIAWTREVFHNIAFKAVSIVDGKISKYRGNLSDGWVDASKGRYRIMAKDIINEQTLWLIANKQKTIDKKHKKSKPSKSKPLTDKQIVEQIEDMQKFLEGCFKNLNRSTRVSKGSMIAALSTAAMMLHAFKENFQEKKK